MKNIIVGIGEALWDCLPEGRKLGGAPVNFAYHVAQHGMQSIAVSAVGNDALGDEYIAGLEQVNQAQYIVRVAQPTGTVHVSLSEDGIPTYEICKNVAWDNIPWTPELEALARESQAVCFGSLAQRSEISRDTILRFIDSMSLDAECIFDINLRQSFYSLEVITESLKRATILKLNDEEIKVIQEFLKLEGETEAVCRQIIEQFPRLKMVILTCGAVGSYVFTADKTSYIPTPKVDVADTVGAGDSFTATFVAQLLKGRPIEEAHRRAVAVSAFVCTQNGAMPVIPPELTD